MKKLVQFLTCVIVLSATAVWAQIPQTISYQGILTDGNGTVVSDGSYLLDFNLYNTADDGEPLWTESHEAEITNGLFYVILGTTHPLNLPFDESYYLGITVSEGTELSPRIEMTAAAYSLNARSVADSSVTGADLQNGQVVRSVNSLKDDVFLKAGDNVSISQVEDSLVISSSGGSSLWSQNGNNLYYLMGNIGIGAVSVPYPLTMFPATNSRGISLTHFHDLSQETSTINVHLNKSASDNSTAYGIFDQTTNDAGGGQAIAVYGLANGNSTGAKIGLRGYAQGEGTHYGVYGHADGEGMQYGVYGSASGTGTLWAGYFAGNVYADAFNVGGTEGALFQGTLGSGTIPATGAGMRMMWYPRKAAFRAGYAGGTQWDDNNIGNFSTAAGLSTTASGQTSTAFGESTTASGYTSTALGIGTTASGEYSTAMGQSTTASGTATTTLGYYTIASGAYSTAIGERIQAEGSHTVAIALSNQNGLRVAQDSVLAIMGGKVGIGTATPTEELEVNGTIYSVSGGFRFPDGTTQTTAASGGSTAGNTLDLAYDQGGAGAGRTITADNGAVNIQGNDGLTVNGNVGIGTTNATYPLTVIPGTSNRGISIDHNQSGSGDTYGIYMDLVRTAAGDNQVCGIYSGATGNEGNLPVYGLFGSADGNAAGSKMGVYGTVSGTGSNYAVNGINTSAGNEVQYGMRGTCVGNGTGAHYGLYGNTQGLSLQYGVYGYANGTGTAAQYGVRGEAAGTGTGTHYGVYGTASGAGTLWAGYFSGNVYTSGNLGIGTLNPTTPLQVNGTIYSSSGGFRFPDGTTQTTAATGGSGGNTLDQAYDQGGAGAGRTITADNGAVSIQGSDGLTVNGNVGIGTTNATYPLTVMPGTDTWGLVVEHNQTGAGETRGLVVDVNKTYTGDSHIYGGSFWATNDHGSGMTRGVFSSVDGTSSGIKIGVAGSATGAGEHYGVTGTVTGSGSQYGVYGSATGTDAGNKIGVYGAAAGTGTLWAGYFTGGNVYIQNRIGINQTNPTSELDILGDFRVTHGGVTIRSDGDQILLNTGTANIIIDVDGSISITSTGPTTINSLADLNLSGNNVNITAVNDLNMTANTIDAQGTEHILLNATIEDRGAARAFDGTMTPALGVGWITGASGSVLIGD